MRKYLVNYRVDISETSTIPYLEYTAIYEVESMMTQEDVEAPTLMCKGCVYNGKFECIQHACRADPNNPVKYIEVTE